MLQDLTTLLKPVVEIARAAGTEILRIYDTDFDVETKADDSPLTAADQASHRAILDALANFTPDISVLSEESAEIPFDERAGWGEYWLVDPLDGTKEFIKRNGEFTVNIALIQGHEPTLGVVYAPALDRMFFGAKGAGAFEQRGGTDPSPIRATGHAPSPLRVVGSRSHRGASLDAFLERVGEYVMVPMGSSLKICLVAAGEADIYPRLGPTSEWDTAAAHGVARFAGAHVTQASGEPLLYNAKADILNPHFLVFGDDSRDWSRML